VKKLSFNKTFTIKKGGSERGEMLDKFLARLNPEREEKGYRGMSHAGISTVLQKIPTDDLYAFYQDCDRAKKFGAHFWWALKK